MFNKKAQAAMEFLMTYGWAILIVLAVIATLTSFGVLNTDIFIPSKCVIGSVGNLNCVNYKLDTNGQLYFKIQNGGGKGDLVLKSINLEKGDLGSEECGGNFVPSLNGAYAAGKGLSFAAHETVAFYVGKSASGKEQALAVTDTTEADAKTLTCDGLANKPEGRKMKAEIRLGYATLDDPGIDHTFSGELVLPVEEPTEAILTDEQKAAAAEAAAAAAAEAEAACSVDNLASCSQDECADLGVAVAFWNPADTECQSSIG